ncbi:BAR domain-containing family protein [Lentinula raphanica]|uniref:BAR domain-containing family protein n=1 Tax=Lentinula raphanica TaxID=153919 RepID=A0AA38NXS6_9AGAR|nr:BAR domain-containing family protein [Lentinula raphanica]KAJ3764245.1 BAR domain-containing family protein [Lentinula raphanica]KAJ3767916.1 BAR domain-containing family protein [Lentinula raphanica]KAJ3821423.1 BAR domain-containing family protein [Lentinula raphanica]KAJ3832582.1 BAR domain-containing family protein [Lentinula raphanica]
MEGWKTLQSGLANLNLGQSANKFTKGFQSSVQATKERLGQVSQDEITELPQEYKDLEARVDALRNAHLAMLKITKVYDTEAYDYPVQIQESISELSNTIGTNFQNFAATNLKGTPLSPGATAPRPHLETPHKTLPHALTRASHTASQLLISTPAGDSSKLGKALALYTQANETIANARIQHDQAVQDGYLHPWQTTLSTSINVAMKARQAVRTSRLELDAAKQGLKSASHARQEQARLEVENAEDDLVQKTEVAITLMKTVLENPEPLKNLNELVKAQLVFYSTAAEALSGVQGEIEELSVAAEGEYRKSRDH